MNLLDRLETEIGHLAARLGISLSGSTLNDVGERNWRSSISSSAASDAEDYLIRQQLRHWAGQQVPPQPGKFRLLHTVIQGKNLEIMDETETRATKKHRPLPPSYWGQEAKAGYLAFTFQYIHIRVVA